MPFKTHFFIYLKRVLAVSMCLIGLAFVAQTARAERVLSETTFDERGVVAKTYDELNPPDDSVREQPIEPKADAKIGPSTIDSTERGAGNAAESSTSGLVQFFSNLFGSDDNRQEPSEKAEERLGVSSIVVGQDVTVSSVVNETTVNVNTVEEPKTPSQAAMSFPELNTDENRAERLQAIFGDAESEVSTLATVRGQDEDQDTIDRSEESVTVVVESPVVDGLESEVDKNLEPKRLSGERQVQDSEETPNLVQRFFNLFKQKPDEPESVARDQEGVVSNEEVEEPRSFAAELPSIQGQPDFIPNEPTSGLSDKPEMAAQPREKIPEIGSMPDVIVSPPPVIPNAKESMPSLKKTPPIVMDKNQPLPNEPGVLNPLMIGYRLDAFALGLINDVRKGEGREPFQMFAQMISDVFFSTPTVLRLLELEKTLNTQIAEARALERPQVSFSVEEGRRTVSNGGADGRISSQTITATQSVWDFGIIRSGIDQSRNNVEKSMAEIRDSRSQALLDLILGYNEVATARMNMQLVQVFAETRVQFLDLVDQKLALGVSSEADLVRAEAKAYEAQGELPAAAQRLQAAEDRFIELFGVVPPKQLPAYALPSNQLSLAELGLTTERHPIVTASELEYQNSQLNLQRLSAEKLGTVNFQLSGSRSDTPTTSSTDQIDGKIVYQVDLYDGGDLSARLERASGAVVEARWELERVRRETRRVLESAISELVASQSLESARLNSLEATVKASDATKELFMYDRGDLTDIFRVQDDYLNAAKALVDARAGKQNAIYSSLHAADLLIEQFGLGI